MLKCNFLPSGLDVFQGRSFPAINTILAPMSAFTPSGMPPIKNEALIIPLTSSVARQRCQDWKSDRLRHSRPCPTDLLLHPVFDEAEALAYMMRRKSRGFS